MARIRFKAITTTKAGALAPAKEAMEMEIWKDIKGYEGLYQISNCGRLKSFKKISSGYIMSNKNQNGWYFTVALLKNNTRVTARIHRMVAEAFILNPDNKPEINHKDLNKQNNHVDNLEWVTRKENVSHAIKLCPGMLKGMNNYNKLVRPKPILQYTLTGKLLASYINGFEASVATGVCQRNILQVANKEEYKPGFTRKQAGGYVWKFKIEGRKRVAS